MAFVLRLISMIRSDIERADGDKSGAPFITSCSDATLWKCLVRGVNQSPVVINLIRVTGRGPINPPHYHAALCTGLPSKGPSPRSST